MLNNYVDLALGCKSVHPIKCMMDGWFAISARLVGTSPAAIVSSLDWAASAALFLWLFRRRLGDGRPMAGRQERELESHKGDYQALDKLSHRLEPVVLL